MAIKLQKREQEKNANFYRKQGLVPGILYGLDIGNSLVFVDFSEINAVFKKLAGQLTSFQYENKIIEGILQDFHIEPISNKIIHFDIYVPVFNKPVTTTVPLVFLHTEELEKQGLVVNKNLNEIEIEALPKDIPENIKVDLSSLEHAHQSLFVKDLQISDRLKITISAETPIVSILQAEE